MWNIETKASKMDFDALASTSYLDVSPDKQIPMIRPFIPVILPLSIVRDIRLFMK